jgi:hypothetical protein
VLLHLPQIPQALTRERTRASAARGRRLTAGAMSQPGHRVVLSVVGRAVAILRCPIKKFYKIFKGSVLLLLRVRSKSFTRQSLNPRWLTQQKTYTQQLKWKTFYCKTFLWELSSHRMKLSTAFFWVVNMCNLIGGPPPPRRWGGPSTQAWMPTYVSILRIPQMIWVWRATVEWYSDRGKPKNSKKNLSQWYFVHHKYHMDWPGREPGPPRWEAGD